MMAGWLLALDGASLISWEAIDHMEGDKKSGVYEGYQWELFTRFIHMHNGS